MNKNTAKKALKKLTIVTIGAGTSFFMTEVIYKVMPEAKLWQKVTAALAGCYTTAALYNHIGVFPLVDVVTSDIVDDVDELAKRLGYVREEY